jgi:hypothetical protein
LGAAVWRTRQLTAAAAELATTAKMASAGKAFMLEALRSCENREDTTTGSGRAGKNATKNLA